MSYFWLKLTIAVIIDCMVAGGDTDTGDSFAEADKFFVVLKCDFHKKYKVFLFVIFAYDTVEFVLCELLLLFLI